MTGVKKSISQPLYKSGINRFKAVKDGDGAKGIYAVTLDNDDVDTISRAVAYS